MAKPSKQHKRASVGKAATHKRSTRHKPREARGSASSRGYGHRWSKFRLSFLARNPLCEYCQAKGRVEAANICDHDLPHDHDPALFWNNTFTALCKPCHDSTKQRMERRYSGDYLLRAIREAKQKRFGYSIPHGLMNSNVPVTLVCGPPAGGKSTWVRANSQEEDIAIDLDVYRERIGGAKWDNNPAIVKEAFRLRANDIKSLHERSTGRAYLIVLAPTKAERDAWSDALGKTTVKIIAPPQDVCISRAKSDRRRASVLSMQAPAIRKWFTDWTE